jgi:hypothetical protein
MVGKRTRIDPRGMYAYVRGFNYEIGGHYTRESFFHSVDSHTNKRNGRQYVLLPLETKSRVWHYHPRAYGMWPSFEDLTINVNKETKSLIFTEIGVWVFTIGPSIRQNAEHMQSTFNIWSDFHKFMLRNHLTLPDKDVVKTFKTFSKFLRTHGYTAYFFTSAENPSTWFD